MNQIKELEAIIKTSIPDSLKAIIIAPPPITPGSHRFLTADQMQAGWLSVFHQGGRLTGGIPGNALLTNTNNDNH